MGLRPLSHTAVQSTDDITAVISRYSANLTAAAAARVCVDRWIVGYQMFVCTVSMMLWRM